MTSTRAVLLAVSLGLLVVARARPDESGPCARGRVRLVVRDGDAYGPYACDELRRAGVEVELLPPADAPPSLQALRDRLDRGEDVTLEAAGRSRYELATLGGRRGRATLVVTGPELSRYELAELVAAGLDLRIVSTHLSKYELLALVGR